MNEWIEWTGAQDSPVAYGLVEIELRDGGTLLMEANVLDWVHDPFFPESDIVKFREVDSGQLIS